MKNRNGFTLIELIYLILAMFCFIWMGFRAGKFNGTKQTIRSVAKGDLIIQVETNTITATNFTATLNKNDKKIIFSGVID